MKELGTAIRKRRKLLGLSQEEVADLADCTHPVIIQLEKGESIRLENFLNIARVLGLNIKLVDRRTGDEA